VHSRRSSRWYCPITRLAIVAAASLSATSSRLSAQGITTGAIRGTVRTPDGAWVDSATVHVVNQETGFTRQTVVRGGRFLFEGLEVGGPYAIDVRRIGFTPVGQSGLRVSLGDPVELKLTLVAAGLDTVRVTADAPAVRGVGTAISDSMLRRLPTLNGDMYDFLRIVPQVDTHFGLSGAGASFRLNALVIDGLTDRALQGNNAPARAISLDAVKEYRVLLSPFDPRYGGFAGLLVNAVTKSGTNELRGSGYAYLRNAELARSGSFLGTSAYHRELYGFSLGGPIVHDRAFYFFAAEVQRSAAPARGPYIGQPDAAPSLPSADSVNRFAALLHDRGLDAGDGGRVMLPSPSASAFGRVDVELPECGSRLVLRGNYNRMDQSNFQRRDDVPVFQLSSNASTNRAIRRGAAVQLLSQLTPAVFNELQTGFMYNPVGGGFGNALMPSVTVTVGKGTMMTAGPGVGNQGGGSKGTSIEVGDYITVQASPAHTIGFGAHVEFFRYNISGVRTGFGLWTFPSLDALEAGRASSYTIGKDEGTATSPVVGAEPSAYVSDEWRLGDRLSLMLGLRADGLSFSRHPLDNPDVEAVFHRRTTDYPVFRPQWSPRLSFRWQADDDDRTIVRGGAGVFVGRPPMAWLIAPMRFNGSGSLTLTCNGVAVPAFTPYPAPQPATCADGKGPTNGAVALVDRHLRMAEILRSSLAVDRRLPWNVTAGIEALYARTRSDFAFSNLNLAGPVGVDPHGRVMYGSFDANGVAQPATVPGHTFPELVDLHNQSGGDSWSVTAQMYKPWSDRFEMRASYTYSRVRDVQSITNASALIPFDHWAAERPLSGRLDDVATGISAFDIPHRIVASATYVARWKHSTTDISLVYVGESGTPFTYGDSTTGKLGDLNADGTAADDPIYIPRNARDPKEIRFSGDSVAQGEAFEQFISDTPCLNRQRGRIMARNSCRSAWVNTTNLALRQSLPMLGGHRASVQLEVFDVLNLLNSSWGIVEARTPWILGYAGRTPGAASQPIFTFDPSVLRNLPNADSGYQLQLSLRYTF